MYVFIRVSPIGSLYKATLLFFGLSSTLRMTEYRCMGNFYCSCMHEELKDTHRIPFFFLSTVVPSLNIVRQINFY